MTLEVAEPANAKAFTGLWNSFDEDTILNGNKKKNIPNMYRRQNRLVGQVLDACIILHVYEELKRGTSYEGLSFLLPEKYPAKEFAELKKLAEEEKSLKDGEPSKLLPKLIDMATEDTKEKSKKKKDSKPLIKNHRLLVTEDQWNQYIKAFQDYLWESTKREDLIRESHESGGAATIPAAPTLPADPRIKTINEIIHPTIELLDCGPKAHTAIVEKAKRVDSNVSELRDINRVGVLPTELEYAKDFIKIIRLLNKDKAVIDKIDGNKVIPRFFEEQPEVRHNGYYNQKLFVAQDRCIEGDKVTKGNEGTIAEIKIVPAGMLKAEKLSAIIKQVINKLDNKEKYTSDNDEDDRQVQLNRSKLARVYNEQKKNFEDLAADNKNYKDKWPEFDLKKMSKQKANSPETYKKLKDDLVELAIEIHVDAICNEKKEWIEEYLKTAVMDKLKNPTRKDGIMGTDSHGKSWLEIIAKSGNLDLNNIEQEVRAEMGLSKQKQAQAHR